MLPCRANYACILYSAHAIYIQIKLLRAKFISGSLSNTYIFFVCALMAAMCI